MTFRWIATSYSDFHRVIEDYSVLSLGAATFKIARLLSIALMSVHFFACAFFRVKKESAASPDDVVNFYTSRGVDPNVSSFRVCRISASHSPNVVSVGRAYKRHMWATDRYAFICFVRTFVSSVFVGSVVFRYHKLKWHTHLNVTHLNVLFKSRFGYLK